MNKDDKIKEKITELYQLIEESKKNCLIIVEHDKGDQGGVILATHGKQGNPMGDTFITLTSLFRLLVQYDQQFDYSAYNETVKLGTKLMHEFNRKYKLPKVH